MTPAHRRYTSDAASRLTALRTSEITPYRRLIVASLPPMSFNLQRGTFGFADLIEIRMLALLSAHPEVGAKGAHLMAEEARQATSLMRPLSDPSFSAQAQQIARQVGLNARLDVARINEVLSLVDRDGDDQPVRWQIGADAIGEPDASITLDPDLNPRVPIAAPANITINEIAYLRQFLDVEAAAARLGISPGQIRAASRLERMLRIMHTLGPSWDYHHRLAGAPQTNGSANPSTRVSEHANAVPTPLGCRAARLSQAGVSREASTPFFDPSIRDWMIALRAAAPTVNDLAAGRMQTKTKMNAHQEVRFDFELSADQDGWIRGRATARLHTAGATDDRRQSADTTARRPCPKTARKPDVFGQSFRVFGQNPLQVVRGICGVQPVDPNLSAGVYT